jgi:hypothetical protein
MFEALSKSEYFVNALAILILIAPGYVCYSIKEMWVSYREKTQFEKVLNSLIYSSILWSPFWILWVMLRPGKLTKIYLLAISLIGLVVMSCLVIVLAFIMAEAEQKGRVFVFGKKLDVSLKEGHNLPLFEHIFTNKTKEIADIYVYTNDGLIYRGRNFKDKNRGILVGSHPYSGDISFVCDQIKKPNEEKPQKREAKQDKEGFVIRTYIPKEKINKILYRTRQG